MSTEPTPRPFALVRKMTARPSNEPHRTATTLELFFDLCFVVAVAQAGTSLVHALAQGHTAAGITSYLAVFFGIWWAWMNFVWFATAYDNDDVPYRLLTLLQMAGVLVYAAGISRAFDHDWTLAYSGFLIMRVALIVQWLRAARAETGPASTSAYRSAAGYLVCQAGWAGLLFTTGPAQVGVFLLMVIAELSVPLIAAALQVSPWNPRHIAERFGLFTLIVLGETIAAATLAVKTGMEEHTIGAVLPTAAGGLLIVFAAWWIYFAVPGHTYITSTRTAFLWSYGHYAILAATAAIGAGLEVAVEHATGHAHISAAAASAAVTVPAALFLACVHAIHARPHVTTAAQHLILPTAALATLACTYTGTAAIPLTGTVYILATAAILATKRGQAPRPSTK